MRKQRCIVAVMSLTMGLASCEEQGKSTPDWNPGTTELVGENAEGKKIPLVCIPQELKMPPVPTEVIDACALLAVGDDCTFEMKGRCLGPEDEPLVCTPPLPKDKNGPKKPVPQAAIDACLDLELGQNCGFAVNGKCHAGPETGLLACALPPPRPPVEAVQACADLARGAACTFTVDGHTIEGTCNGEGDMPLACGVGARPLVEPASSTAIQSCVDGTEGDDCSFQVDGACLAGENDVLACIPPVFPQR